MSFFQLGDVQAELVSSFFPLTRVSISFLGGKFSGQYSFTWCLDLCDVSFFSGEITILTFTECSGGGRIAARGFETPYDKLRQQLGRFDERKAVGCHFVFLNMSFSRHGGFQARVSRGWTLEGSP